jgi:hypothetical protein
MRNWAHILNGMVVNVSVWDGLTPWSTRDTVVEVPDGLGVGIGWEYDGENFIAPAVMPDPSILS